MLDQTLFNGIAERNLEKVFLAIENGANVHAIAGGWGGMLRPLHAISLCHQKDQNISVTDEDIARLLIAKGADKTIKAISGDQTGSDHRQTAEEIARSPSRYNFSNS